MSVHGPDLHSTLQYNHYITIIVQYKYSTIISDLVTSQSSLSERLRHGGHSPGPVLSVQEVITQSRGYNVKVLRLLRSEMKTSPCLAVVTWSASPLLPKPVSLQCMSAPRSLACCSLSSTRTPAPSPITNPSRPVSKGREALLGLELYLVDRALHIRHYNTVQYSTQLCTLHYSTVQSSAHQTLQES